MRRNHRPDCRLYEQYYCQQAGHGLPTFVGVPNYRGKGIGSLLAGLGRMVMPLLKSGGKTLLKEGLRSGADIARDVLGGQTVKTAFKRRANESGQRLLQRVVDGLAPSSAPAAPKRPRKKKRKTPQPKKRDIFD